MGFGVGAAWSDVMELSAANALSVYIMMLGVLYFSDALWFITLRRGERCFFTTRVRCTFCAFLRTWTGLKRKTAALAAHCTFRVLARGGGVTPNTPPVVRALFVSLEGSGSWKAKLNLPFCL